MKQAINAYHSLILFQDRTDACSGIIYYDEDDPDMIKMEPVGRRMTGVILDEDDVAAIVEIAAANFLTVEVAQAMRDRLDSLIKSHGHG